MSVTIARVVLQDRFAVARWYQPSEPNGANTRPIATYHGTGKAKFGTWRDQHIQAHSDPPSDRVEIFKVELPTGEILGLIDIEIIRDSVDQKEMAVVGGLTANPEYTRLYNAQSSVSGIGRSL